MFVQLEHQKKSRSPDGDDGIITMSLCTESRLITGSAICFPWAVSLLVPHLAFLDGCALDTE